MFDRRVDAELVTGLSKTRQFMPFISPKRNDSLVFYTLGIETAAAQAFIEEQNRTRSRDNRITLFYLILYAVAKAFQERPAVNRVVAGRRLWQRKGTWITYSAKQEILDGSPILTVKQSFPEDEKLDEMIERLHKGLRERRSGKLTRSDKEVKIALSLPPWLIRIGVWLLDRANHLGMLPLGMIEDDPMFTSIFIANLGSVGLHAGYHHLWEYGTCSHFMVVGQTHPRHDGVEIMELKISYDERVEDGLYGAISMEGIKQRLENPELLLTGAPVSYRST